MSLFGLVLAVGTAGLTMGVDLAGSAWRPSFISAAELPAGIKMLEATFFATLQAASSFEQTDTTLVLYDASGAKLAQFVRAEED